MITLRGITWDHPRGYAPLAASTEPYTRLADVRVEWDKRSLKDFGDAPVDVLAEKYDLLIIDHPHVGLAASTGCLLALDTCIAPHVIKELADQSAGPSHASYFYAGHQWALAIDAAMQASAYRPDLLQFTLPDSWDGVIALGQRLKRVGLSIAMPLCPTDAICSFLSLCTSLGSPPGNRNKLVDEATGQRALDYLAQCCRLSPPQCLDWNPIALLNHMSQADAVAYCPLTFCYTNYARDGYAAHLVRFHDIPGIKGAILGGTGFAVSARCTHPAEACAYGVWLCSAQIQSTLYLAHGGQPGNAVAWDDAAANKLTNNFFHDTRKTLDAAYVRPRHNGFVKFQEQAGRVINAFLRDGSSAEDCLNVLSRLYEETLPRDGMT
jgi:multiple sugar transport system substrate-binding protein